MLSDTAIRKYLPSGAGIALYVILIQCYVFYWYYADRVVDDLNFIRGDSSISGLYGPGSLLAWYIATVATTIRLARKLQSPKKPSERTWTISDLLASVIFSTLAFIDDTHMDKL